MIQKQWETLWLEWGQCKPCCDKFQPLLLSGSRPLWSVPSRQIDRKNTKDKIKLLAKSVVNSFTKIPPISARNVPKLPEMSLFEPRKNSKKRIAISKLALQWFKLTAKIGRRRLNYS